MSSSMYRKINNLFDLCEYAKDLGYDCEVCPLSNEEFKYHLCSSIEMGLDEKFFVDYIELIHFLDCVQEKRIKDQIVIMHRTMQDLISQKRYGQLDGREPTFREFYDFVEKTQNDWKLFESGIYQNYCNFPMDFFLDLTFDLMYAGELV